MAEIIKGTRPPIARESLKDVVGPIGTLDEVIEIGASPKTVHSCSLPTGPQAGGNRGCPWAEKYCQFHSWRMQRNGLKGPLNVGVESMLSRDDGGAHNQMQMSCFDYYATNMHNRKKNSGESGELIRIVAYEGDGKEISEWESRAINPRATATGDDKGVIKYINQHPVWPFPRPRERFPMEVGREQAKQEIMDEVEREALANALRKPAMPPQPGEAVLRPEVVGPGRKVGKGGSDDAA